MAAQDYGILISQPGVDVANATASQEMLNTSYPALKIDTQNAAGFQTILLSILTDPPEPNVGIGQYETYTIVYKYKHGYSYRPSIETLFYITVPPPGAHYSTPYFLDWTILGAQSVDDSAAMYAVCDDTWVYYIVQKSNDGLGSSNLLSGTAIQITTHVFLDGVVF
jgi:hypothetical protein